MRHLSDLLRTLPYAALGAAPGLLLYVRNPSNGAILVLCFGAFIVGALSHPSVSLANVFSGLMGTVVHYNAAIRHSDGGRLIAEEGPIDNSEELIVRILEQAAEHGLDDLLPEPKQIALISYAEAAADSETLEEFVSSLTDEERSALRDGYRAVNAQEIVQEWSAWSNGDSILRLQELVQDRRGYDLESLCSLMRTASVSQSNDTSKESGD